VEVIVVGEIRENIAGKFGWILDPEGNKIELWRPVDSAFLNNMMSKKVSTLSRLFFYSKICYSSFSASALELLQPVS
jgi:hypothetical protein